MAAKLHQDWGLPDIGDLLQELNELRKGFAYGELTVEPTMSAEDAAGEIEAYVEAVQNFLEEDE